MGRKKGAGHTALDPNVHTQNPPAVRVFPDPAAEALVAQQARQLGRPIRARNVLRKGTRRLVEKLRAKEDSDEEPETPRRLSTAAPSEPDEEPPKKDLRSNFTAQGGPGGPVYKTPIGKKGGRKTRRRKHNRRRR
jgi:hypothetical protein